jgi:hypothetical protein
MATGFEVLKEMGDRGMSELKSFPLDNVKQINTGKDGWGQVTIAIDNETASKLMTGYPLIFSLVIADGETFRQVKEELEDEKAAEDAEWDEVI